MRVSQEELVEFCKKWKIRELAVFGSILRDDFRPESDIDVLITFEEGAGNTLLDMVRMEAELTQMLGRKVDLVSRKGIEASRNHIRRDNILNSAEIVYAAR